MNRLILAGILVLAFVQVGYCQSYGSSVDNRLFSARVVNIDKTRSGKIFVTIEFVGKLSGMRLQLWRAERACAKSATLLDNDGNEYGTNRCLGDYNGPHGVEASLDILPNSTSQFVFEFTTPLANRTNDRPTYSLIVPINYGASGSAYGSGQTTLSFFRLSPN